jgi:hypothetical protein
LNIDGAADPLREFTSADAISRRPSASGQECAEDEAEKKKILMIFHRLVSTGKDESMGAPGASPESAFEFIAFEIKGEVTARSKAL